MMPGHGTNPVFFNKKSLTKKIKIGRPEHSLTLQPTTSDNISFLLYPPALPLPPQSGCSYVHP